MDKVVGIWGTAVELRRKLSLGSDNPVRILVVWLEQAPASPVLTVEMLPTLSTDTQAVSLWMGHVTVPTCLLISLHSLYLVPFLRATHIYMSPYPRPGQREWRSKRPGPPTQGGWRARAAVRVLQTKSNTSGICLHLLMIIVFDNITCTHVYIHYRASEMISLCLLEHRNV